ncbi:hypothetical protein [Streptomyces sp. IBSBF 2390]
MGHTHTRGRTPALPGRAPPAKNARARPHHRPTDDTPRQAAPEASGA